MSATESAPLPGVDQVAAPTVRLGSIDAYRGLVMFLMMAEALHLAKVAKAFPDSEVWQFLAHHQSHVAWAGCSLHDLIQPSFSFLVGVALPFSLMNRAARGQSRARMLGHAAWRALVLTLLGIFLRSVGRERTNFTFEDTLTQIGLGYFPLFLLGLARPWCQWAALVVILVGYWAAFAGYPLPHPEFDYPAVGVPNDWPEHYAGFMAHWNKNSNLAWAFDRWFLNLFPRTKEFTHNSGGYATLSFIPTLATMILGLIAGGWLRRPWAAWRQVVLLVATGIVCLALGMLAEHFGVCPIVKRIWTPAWTLFSGGWCFLILAAFFTVIDWAGLRAWSFPLRVIGMNSIAAYCMAHLFDGFIVGTFKTHLGQDALQAWGPAYEPLLTGTIVLATLWLILYWMYRQRIFVRI